MRDWAMVRLEEMAGSFWTVRQELVEELEEDGFDVLEENAEYIVVAPVDEDDDVQYQLKLGGTERTITINDIKRIEF